ncbi:MAG: ATP-dependent 6-phosphofructokinase [Methanobacteriota archaeon]|nr:MAG: ATP-dependent 6-phosphofructokinase [Euryarchaeota archaeon]
MKIGILTSGGDTPGMNAVIRGFAMRARGLGHEVIGIKYGWKGLMDGLFMEIPMDYDELIAKGGTILYSGRTNPFKRDDGVARIRKTFKEHGLDAVVAIGGDDTLGVANKLTQEGLPMVGVPKTIDNDLDATDYTFGFNTAYSIAANAMENMKTTARSHGRILVVEVMGRHAGWLTLYAGIAAGAHAILIPEFPLDMQTVASLIRKRFENPETAWAIVAVSEGYEFTSQQTEGVETDEFGHVRLEKLKIGEKVAEFLEKEVGATARAVVLSYLQRSGAPSPYDRVLSTRLGIAAADLVHERKFAMMPSLRGTKIVPVALNDAVDRLKLVDEEHWDVAKKLMGLD